MHVDRAGGFDTQPHLIAAHLEQYVCGPALAVPDRVATTAMTAAMTTTAAMPSAIRTLRPEEPDEERFRGGGPLRGG